MKLFRLESFTAINATRVLLAAIGIPFALNTSYAVFSVALYCLFSFSLLWFLLEQVGVVDVKRREWLALLPTTMDAMFLSLFIVFTGNVNSFIVIAFVYIITICSMNTKSLHGDYALALSLSFYSGVNIGVFFGLFPRINVFGGGADISFASLVTAIAFFAVCAVGMRGIVKRLVIQEATMRAEVTVQKGKVEELLNNILPRAVVEEINEKGKCHPIRAKEATVLFTDFVKFSRITKDMYPEDMVELLDGYFTKFDMILQRKGIEKLKTMGDGYMCVSGVPQYRKDHVETMIEAAKEILDTVNKEREIRIRQGKPYFDIRIGVHTGELCAGIIGKTKFSYDIWGDVVNLASRLETAAETNSINISKNVHECIEHQYETVYRGKIPTKNSGEVEMYRLV